jgi:hypothetical protein
VGKEIEERVDRYESILLFLREFLALLLIAPIRLNSGKPKSVFTFQYDKASLCVTIYSMHTLFGLDTRLTFIYRWSPE